MATKTARSTAAQRADLQRLRIDLQEAFESLDGRFFASGEQRRSYAVVLRHLELWAGFER